MKQFFLAVVLTVGIGLAFWFGFVVGQCQYKPKKVHTVTVRQIPIFLLSGHYDVQLETGPVLSWSHNAGD